MISRIMEIVCFLSIYLQNKTKKDISNCDRTYVEKRIPTQYEITSYIVATGAGPIP